MYDRRFFSQQRQKGFNKELFISGLHICIFTEKIYLSVNHAAGRSRLEAVSRR
jgi:hypothetical protein